MEDEIRFPLASSGKSAEFTFDHTYNMSQDEVAIHANRLANYIMHNTSARFVDYFVTCWREMCIRISEKTGEENYNFCKENRLTAICDDCNCKFKCWTQQ